MTAFVDLQTQTIFGRFKETQRDPYIKAWLNTRYTRIWTAFEWRFRYTEPVVVSFKAGNRQLGPVGSANPMPADFGSVMVGGLMRADGTVLEELGYQEFVGAFQYAHVIGQTGEPTHFCTVDNKVLVGPTPTGDETGYLGYKRRLVHDNGSGAAVVGVMVANADKPYWPEEHYEVLVVGAQALGLKLSNDPTWQALELQHDDLVQGMLADGLLLSENPAIRKPSRDTL